MPYKLDFKQIAEDIDVLTVARHFSLKLKREGNEFRARCPVCDSGDDRALHLYAETNSFRCHAAELSGDCISFYAHLMRYDGMYKAAKELLELFGTAAAARTVQATAPQKPEGRSQPAPTKPEGFDPAAITAKLTYTDEVAALGISEKDAAMLGIGFHAGAGFLRGRVAFAIRNETGAIVGFIGYQEGGKPSLKIPNRWMSPKVVPFARRA